MDEDRIRALVEVSTGHRMPDQQVVALERHLSMVLERNKVMNLTAIRERDDGLVLHIADSLLALGEVNDAPPGPLVDLGSGGGYPAIPLCIATGRSTTMVESVRKKAEFLREVASELGLPCEVSADRAEDVGRSHPGAFAVVTARALTALPSLVELAAPLLSMGGRLIAYKGDLGQDESARGRAAARLCGLRESHTSEMTLPERGDRRVLVVYERVGRPTLSLPRRVGLAQSKPLA